jgi:multicomponent Na+:H+ antiporter subunit E
MAFVLTFLILALFWILFSGRLDGLHLSLGFVSCIIVAGWSHRLFFPDGVDWGFLGVWLRFVGYFPWLLFQIFLANLHVLYLVFHPRMLDLIDPHIIEFESRLTSDVARTTFANSITLTPGTITVHANIMGRFAVHCIDDPSGEGLPGKMERKISRIFKE